MHNAPCLPGVVVCSREKKSWRMHYVFVFVVATVCVCFCWSQTARAVCLPVSSACLPVCLSHTRTRTTYAYLRLLRRYLDLLRPLSRSSPPPPPPSCLMYIYTHSAAICSSCGRGLFLVASNANLEEEDRRELQARARSTMLEQYESLEYGRLMSSPPQTSLIRCTLLIL